MKHLDNFGSHINERLGIADASVSFVNPIKDRALFEIIDFINSNPTVGYHEEKNIVINYNNIRKYISDWDVYEDFPVSEIVINLFNGKFLPSQVKWRESESRKEVKIPFAISAEAYSFAREKGASKIKNPIEVKRLGAIDEPHTISISLKIEFIYSSLFDIRNNRKKLEVKLESVILHELNHLYEQYRRKLFGSKDIEYTATWASLGSNKRRRPKKIFEFWQDYFTSYIYMSVPQEVRAYIQESKAYVDKLDFESFKKTPVWKEAKFMENFSVDEFLKDFNKVVYDYNPDYVERMIDILVNDFKKDYKTLSEEWGEINVIKPEFIENLSTEKFLKFWEKEIRKAGSKIVRNMIRLYSLKKEEGESIY